MNVSLGDRLAGGIWGHLVGDAIGVPYEFGPAVPDDVQRGPQHCRAVSRRPGGRSSTRTLGPRPRQPIPCPMLGGPHLNALLRLRLLQSC